jgi:hypothetical protein
MPRVKSDPGPVPQGPEASVAASLMGRARCSTCCVTGSASGDIVHGDKATGPAADHRP